MTGASDSPDVPIEPAPAGGAGGGAPNAEAGPIVVSKPARGKLMRRLASLNLLGAAFGAVYQADIAVASRRRGTYLLRGGLVALMGAIVVLAFMGAMEYSAYSAAERIEAASEVATSFTLAALGILMGGMTLMSMVLTSGAFIQERKARTLSAIATSPLTAADLVLGKLSSRLTQIVLLILACAPLLLLVRVYGGVPVDLVLRCTALTLASALLAGSIAMMYSAWHRHEWSVMLMTLITYGLVNAAPPVIVSLFALQSPAGMPPLWIFACMFLSTPASFVLVISQETLPVGVPFPDDLWLLGIAWAVGLSIVFNLVSMGALRTMMFAEAAGWQAGVSGFIPMGRQRLSKRALRALEAQAKEQAGERAGGDDAAPVVAKPAKKAKRDRVVTGNPVRWRESHLSLLRGRTLRVIAAIIVVGLAFFYFVTSWDFEPSHLVVMQSALVIFLFLACTVPGGTFAGERDTGSLEVLLTTPMTSREIVMGKVLGTLRRLAFLPAYMLGHIAVFVVLGFIHPWTLAHAALSVIPVGVLLVSLGVFFSTVCRRARTASAMSLGTVIGVWAIAPVVVVLITQMMGLWLDEQPWQSLGTLWMMGLPPFVFGESISTGVELAGGTSMWTYYGYDPGYSIPPFDIDDDSGLGFAMWQAGTGVLYLLASAGLIALAAARLRHVGQRVSRAARVESEG